MARPSAGEALARLKDRELLREAVLAIEPRTDEHLWRYLAMIGFRVPRVSVCAGHRAPFGFVADAFFNRVHGALVLAGRGSGKTRNLALLNLLVSKFRPGTVTAHIGAISRQSSWGYEYLREMFSSESLFKDDLLFLPTRSSTVWKNGSQVNISTGSSLTGVTALRASRLVLDEIDLWDSDLFEMAQQMVSGDREHPGQRLMVSTRYTEGGLMNRLLQQAEKRRWEVYRFCEFEIMERCRSCDGPRCPLFSWNNPFSGRSEELCRGRGLRADGWKPRREVIRDFWSSDPREWAIERLLFAPGVHKRVYPAFSRSIHVSPFALPFSGSEVLVAGIDWGWDHPFAIAVWCRRGEVWTALDERKERFVLPERELELASELQSRWDPLIFFCSKEDPQAIARFQQAGFNAVPTLSTRVAPGIRLISRLLVPRPGRGPRLLVSPNCPMLIKEFETYHRDSKNRLVSRNDDLLDASRYAIESADLLALGSGGAFRV